jgi:hypothetical protein
VIEQAVERAKSMAGEEPEEDTPEPEAAPEPAGATA